MLMKTRPLSLNAATHPQARVCAACGVRSSALFGALDAVALEHIHARIDSPLLQPDQPVYTAGSRGGAVHTVREGIVRFERVTAGGARRIVRLAGRGDLIGQEALLGQPYRDDAVACTPLALCRIPVSLVDRLGATDAELPRELMRRWQVALDDAESWSAELATGAARRRVLKLLMLLQRHADDPARIWLPRREQMGDMLDMTFETASRVVSRLRREGVLELLPRQQARVDAARAAAALRALDV